MSRNSIPLLVIFLFLLSPLLGEEERILYKKNVVLPTTDEEKAFVDQVKTSFEKASRFQSKLTAKPFEEVAASEKWKETHIPHYHTLSGIPQYAAYHLLNNLCSLPGASHLHVGLLAGDSFIAALYENQSTMKQQIGIDWFKECPEDIFYANCDQYLAKDKLQIINGECFNIEKSLIQQPIDIYFYDADHGIKAHEKAFTYFNDVFANVFAVVIDDWSGPWVRGSTFRSFDKLGYSILWENTLMNLKADDMGQYVAVIRKPHNPIIIEENQETREFNEKLQRDLKFTSLKNKVFQSIRESWCTEEKANLIMEIIYHVRPDICVEVGAFTGSSFLPIVSVLSLLEHGHAYAIDAWSNVEVVKGLSSIDKHYLWWSTVNMHTVYRSFLKTLGDTSLTPYYTTLQVCSSEAVSQFDRIDFLHLDGNFSEEGSLEDATLYLPKVSSGGYILLSNLFFISNKKYPKMKTLDVLLKQCEIVAEVDNGQTVLFKKN